MQERQERLKSLKVKFSDKSKMMNFASCSGNLEGASVEVLGDAMTGYIVNVVREKGEEAVRIPPSISSKLKAHQVSFYPCLVSHRLSRLLVATFCFLYPKYNDIASNPAHYPLGFFALHLSQN